MNQNNDKSKTPYVVQSLWIGDELSNTEKLCIHSYLNYGYSFHLYAYDEIKNVPKGVIVKDASVILPRERIFKYKEYDTYAGFANLFRYKLILETGQAWTDLDIICLSSNATLGKYIIAGQHPDDPKDATFAGNCFLKAPADSLLMQYLFETASQKRNDELQWGETGPALLNKAVKLLKMEDFVSSPYRYCPIHHHQWKEYIKPLSAPSLAWMKILFRVNQTHGLHLWNEMWRRNDMDKNNSYPYSSLYEYYKRKYLPKIDNH